MVFWSVLVTRRSFHLVPIPLTIIHSYASYYGKNGLFTGLRYNKLQAYKMRPMYRNCHPLMKLLTSYFVASLFVVDDVIAVPDIIVCAKHNSKPGTYGNCVFSVSF